MNEYMIPNITIHRFVAESITTGSANAVDSYMDTNNIPLIQRANLDWENMQKVKQVIEFSF